MLRLLPPLVGDWLPDWDNPFRADPAAGHARLAHGFLAHLRQPAGNAQISPPTDQVSGYWSTYGLDHLGYSGEALPAGLAAATFAPVAVSAQEYVYALGLWTKNGLPTTMRHYVQRLLHDRRFDDILTLVQLLGEVAMYYYIQDGLVRERIEEARIVYEIGSQATDGPTVFSALKVTGYAGAIVRAAKNSPELALTVSQATQLMNEVRILRYMAGGFEIAGWAHNISGSFEDVGGCLYRELTELTDAP